VTEPPATASTEALENANRALDEIIHRGRITQEDVNKLRNELATATAEQRDQVRARIASAINRDELVPVDLHALYP
jgi:polyhydroxyalkanoate synthesis regulator phasin